MCWDIKKDEAWKKSIGQKESWMEAEVRVERAEEREEDKGTDSKCIEILSKAYQWWGAKVVMAAGEWCKGLFL